MVLIQPDEISSIIKSKIENYNSFVDKNKYVDVYLYYLEKDTDINFKTDKKIDIFETDCDMCNQEMFEKQIDVLLDKYENELVKKGE